MKDTLFTDLFREVKYQKKLYYALFGEGEEIGDEDIKLILLYIAHTYQNYIKENEIYLYGEKKVKLPKPYFFLVYTGEKEMTEENLRLSSLYFESEKEEKPLELRVDIVTLRNAML